MAKIRAFDGGVADDLAEMKELYRREALQRKLLYNKVILANNNVGLMLDQRRRRSADIKPTFGQRLLFGMFIFQFNLYLLFLACAPYFMSTPVKFDPPLTLSSLNLPLSSSSTTSRELLSQFSTCCG